MWPGICQRWSQRCTGVVLPSGCTSWERMVVRGGLWGVFDTATPQKNSAITASPQNKTCNHRNTKKIDLCSVYRNTAILETSHRNTAIRDFFHRNTAIKMHHHRTPQDLRSPQHRNFEFFSPQHRNKNAPTPQHRKPQGPPLLIV